MESSGLVMFGQASGCFLLLAHFWMDPRVDEAATLHSATSFTVQYAIHVDAELARHRPVSRRVHADIAVREPARIGCVQNGETQNEDGNRYADGHQSSYRSSTNDGWPTGSWIGIAGAIPTAEPTAGLVIRNEGRRRYLLSLKPLD